MTTLTAPIASPRRSKLASDKEAIRPFVIDVPQADLDDLRRRIAATRFPDKETVADQSQGTQLATSQALATWNREPLFHLSSPLAGWQGPRPEVRRRFSGAHGSGTSLTEKPSPSSVIVNLASVAVTCTTIVTFFISSY